MRKITTTALTLLLPLSVACTTESYGECPTPNDDLLWFQKTQAGPLGTNNWCVVCSSTVSRSEASAWVEDNAGESFLDSDWSTDGVTPCLYVYPSGDEDLSTKATCKPAACEDDPNVNDAVYESHGVWDFIEPILY